MTVKPDPGPYDQLPLCPYCHQPDDECRCAFAWKDGERVPLPGRKDMTPPLSETKPHPCA